MEVPEMMQVAKRNLRSATVHLFLALCLVPGRLSAQSTQTTAESSFSDRTEGEGGHRLESSLRTRRIYASSMSVRSMSFSDLTTGAFARDRWLFEAAHAPRTIQKRAKSFPQQIRSRP